MGVAVGAVAIYITTHADCGGGFVAGVK